MFENAFAFTALMLALFVLTIWMLVRIWRSSPLLAILTFFLWPFALIALVKNWGQKDSDIRVPFVLSLVVGGLMMFMAMRTVDAGVEEIARAISDEELESMRTQDPDMARAIDEARAGGYAADGSNPEAGGADRAAGASASPAAAEATVVADKRDPAQIEAALRSELRNATSGVSWRLGKQDLATAAAVLPLPSQFRFAPRATLIRLANLRGTPLPSDVLGWIVHRDVDLGREDAWYVQLRFVPLAAPIAPPDRALLSDATELAEQGAFVRRIAAAVEARVVASPLLPSWNEAAGTAAWDRAGADSQSPFDTSHVAVRVLPGGLLEFTVSGLHEAHAELGRRSVNLLASRTVPR